MPTRYWVSEISTRRPSSMASARSALSSALSLRLGVRTVAETSIGLERQSNSRSESRARLSTACMISPRMVRLACASHAIWRSAMNSGTARVTRLTMMMIFCQSV